MQTGDLESWPDRACPGDLLVGLSIEDVIEGVIKDVIENMG